MVNPKIFDPLSQRVYYLVGILLFIIEFALKTVINFNCTELKRNIMQYDYYKRKIFKIIFAYKKVK